MGRKAIKCPKKCSSHQFSLKPIRYSAYFSREVHLSFCPPSLKHSAIHPHFNKDSRHYTPSFTLKDDQPKYQANAHFYQSQHQKFCEDQLTGKTLMLQPKPRSKSQHCHVCRIPYQDYSEHIQTQEHKLKLRINKFSSYIDELAGKYLPSVQEFEPSSSSLIFQESIGMEKQCIMTTPSISSQNYLRLPVEIISFSPFKPSEKGGFDLPEHKPDIIEKVLQINEDQSEKLQEQFQKRVSTNAEDKQKLPSMEPRFNEAGIFNRFATLQ